MPQTRHSLLLVVFVLTTGCTVGEERVDADSEADSDDSDQLDTVDELLAQTAPEQDVTADRDQDGIPDATEEVLLRRYRPDIVKPFRMWLYPLPALVSLTMWIYIFVTAPLAGILFAIGFLAVAIAAYFVFAARGRGGHESTKARKRFLVS